MKSVFFLGTVSLLASFISGCNNSTSPAGGSSPANAATLVGEWKCATKSADSPSELPDNKTFSAEGWYSSSKFPEGKKYQYRLDGNKLTVSMPTGEWTEKITALTAGVLEYYNDKSGKPIKVSCQKSQ